MTNKKQNQIHIGCSGFYYRHWMGNFYPEGLKQKDFFDYYLRYFRTLELNSSFYRLPKAATFKNWKRKVPDDFIFSVKAPRYITHMKKLILPNDLFEPFFENVSELGNKLGPILFQLPPGWKYDADRFNNFLNELPKGHRYTFEFRNHTWYNKEVYELLHQHNIAFCMYELQYHMSPLEVTTDFIYVRLHGPEWKYSGSYSESALQWWADYMKEQQQDGRDVYIYFDNDQLGYAAFNAIRLRELVHGIKFDKTLSLLHE